MEDLKRLIFPAMVALILHGVLIGLKLPRHAPLKPVLNGNPIKIEINEVSPQRTVSKRKEEIRKTKNIPNRISSENVAQKNIPKQSVVEKDDHKLLKQKKKDLVPQIKQLKKQIIDKVAAIPAEAAARTNTENSENDLKREMRKEKVSTAPIQTKAIPKYRQNRQPSYPLIAKRRGYEGEILLSVLVDGAGTVSEITIKNSSGHLSLDNAALNTVKNWLFTPAAVNGRPVAMWVDVPIQFQLK